MGQLQPRCSHATSKTGTSTTELQSRRIETTMERGQVQPGCSHAALTLRTPRHQRPGGHIPRERRPGKPRRLPRRTMPYPEGLGHCRRKVRPVHTNKPTHLQKHCVHFGPVPLDPKCALRDGFFEVPQVHHPHIDTVFVLNARWSFLRCVLNTTTGPDIDFASACSSFWTASSLLAVFTFSATPSSNLRG